jgi:hypothetical protein
VCHTYIFSPLYNQKILKTFFCPTCRVQSQIKDFGPLPQKCSVQTLWEGSYVRLLFACCPAVPSTQTQHDTVSAGPPGAQGKLPRLSDPTSPYSGHPLLRPLGLRQWNSAAHPPYSQWEDPVYYLSSWWWSVSSPWSLPIMITGTRM